MLYYRQHNTTLSRSIYDGECVGVMREPHIKKYRDIRDNRIS